jgi:biopolymer transport protein ExbB
MKRFITFLALAALLTTGVFNQVYAQADQAAQTTQVATESRGFHQAIKDYFIQGGAGFMASILMCLIFGLAISIERTLYLNLSNTNTKKLLNQLETTLESRGIEAAKEICKNTRGPVASIFFQGLTRYDEGLEMVEKSIVSYGGVLMGRLENGMTWISLFIATAPMLGFLGTVIGMVQAFDAIEAAGDISPTIVAGGIKVALLTTVFGLITAIILQFFYNYLTSRIDSIVNDMEDSTISFVDLLSKFKK